MSKLTGEWEKIHDALASLWGMPVALKWFSVVGGAVLSYFLPTEDLRNIALATFGLVIIDTVTGIVAAKASGDAVTSSKFSRLITKLVMYSALVCGSVLVVRSVPGMGGNLVAAAATASIAIIAAREGLSVAENFKRLGIAVPQGWIDAVKSAGEKPEETEEKQ